MIIIIRKRKDKTRPDETRTKEGRNKAYSTLLYSTCFEYLSICLFVVFFQTKWFGLNLREWHTFEEFVRKVRQRQRRAVEVVVPAKGVL